MDRIYLMNVDVMTSDECYDQIFACDAAYKAAVASGDTARAALEAGEVKAWEAAYRRAEAAGR